MTTSAPRADAAVHEHDGVVADRRAHLDERVERGDRAVDLAAAVVRDDDARRRRRRARARASSAVSTPFTSSGSDVCSRSQARSSHVSARFGNVAEHRRGRGEQVLLGRLVEPRAEDRVGEELRAALALEERQVGVAQVARPPAERERVERDDDRAVAGRLGAA